MGNAIILSSTSTGPRHERQAGSGRCPRPLPDHSRRARHRSGCSRGSRRCWPRRGLLQYRNKAADSQLRREQALALLPLCRAHGVAADHQRRLATGAARSAPTARTWANTTGDLAEARAALGCKRDHRRLLLRRSRSRRTRRGRAAPTTSPSAPSSPRDQAAGPPGAAWTCCATRRRLGLPTVAIGGITPDNAGPSSRRAPT